MPGNNPIHPHDSLRASARATPNLERLPSPMNDSLSRKYGRVRKAVFPVGGSGTRFLPATKAMPKEMLPVVDKPLIQYAVEEAAAAGIEMMIFVTGRNKRAIEDHFDRSPELEMLLQANAKNELLDALMSATPKGVNFVFVRQPEPLGLGHAVLCLSLIHI